MLYKCKYCGHDINPRYFRNPREEDNPRIGSHLLYEHSAFCSDFCIELWKQCKYKPTHTSVLNGAEKSADYCDVPASQWRLERRMRKNKPKQK